MRINIPAPVNRIIEELNKHGYEAYAVGGCVRDALLNREPDDWDITTSARPEQVKEIFRRTIDTGIQHGTVTIMMDHVGYEVTTYRIDGSYADGRHPDSVEFTSNLLEDLRRRDFTINAMAYSHGTGIVDAYGGVEDLNNKIIRCVGNPMERFTEDALRILRAIRFSAQLGFEIEAETQAAITTIAPNMVHVSKERIQVELTKLLKSAHPERMKLVYETGISPYLTDNFGKIDPDQIAVSAELPADKHIRWAAFLTQLTPELAAKVLRELKMDNDTISKAKTLVDWMHRELPGNPYELRKALCQIGPELWDDLMELKLAECTDQEDGDRMIRYVWGQEKFIVASGECYNMKMLAVTGNDVIQAGVKPGKEVGAVLNQLLESVLKNPYNNEKEYLLSCVHKMI